jgi:hypothetical protein
MRKVSMACGATPEPNCGWQLAGAGLKVLLALESALN